MQPGSRSRVAVGAGSNVATGRQRPRRLPLCWDPLRDPATRLRAKALTSPEQLARPAVSPLDHRPWDRALAKRDLVTAVRALAPRVSVPESDHQPFLTLLAYPLGVPAVVVRTGA